MSSLTTSTIRASTIGVSTLTASSITTNTLNGTATTVSSLSGSTITTSTLSGNTIAINSLTASTITVSTLGYSTLSGSSITTSAMGYSSLTGSTITTNAMGYYSLTGSTITTNAMGYSSLTGSTITTNAMGYSSITGSTITTNAMGYSTLSGSTIAAQNITLSSLTVSSINNAAPASGWSTSTGGGAYYTTGNIGIGTENPVGNFHVYASSGPFINMGTAAYLSSLTMGIASGTGSFSSSAAVNDVVIRATSASSNMMLQTGVGAAAIYINSSNNVGIGTNNPGSKFVVYHSANSQFTVFNGGTDIIGSDVVGTSLGVSFSSNNSGTSNYGTTTYGRFGRLTVNYNTAQGGTGQASFWRDWGIDNNGSLFFTLNQSVVQALTLTSSGSVGIGSSSPTATLQVSASTSVYGQLRLVNSTAATANEVSMGYFNNPSASFAGATGSAWCHGIASYGVGANNFGFGCVNTGLIMSMLSSGNVGIGITTPTSKLHVNGAIFAVGDITALSDQRYKQNIVRLDHSLDMIRSINGYSYTRQDYRPGERQIGLLAQELSKVLPEAVSYDSNNDQYSINYNSLIAPLVEAVKELYDRVELQSKMIDKQQLLIQQLLSRA